MFQRIPEWHDKRYLYFWFQHNNRLPKYSKSRTNQTFSLIRSAINKACAETHLARYDQPLKVTKSSKNWCIGINLAMISIVAYIIATELWCTASQASELRLLDRQSYILQFCVPKLQYCLFTQHKYSQFLFIRQWKWMQSRNLWHLITDMSN